MDGPMTQGVQAKPAKNAKGTGSEVRNVLSFEQRVKLLDLMRAKQADLLQRRPPLQQVADELAIEAGFPVSSVNVESVMRVSGIKWRAPRQRSGRAPRLGMKARLKQLEKQMRILCEKLGEPCLLEKVYKNPKVGQLFDAA
jgi:hypothetical protein